MKRVVLQYPSGLFRIWGAIAQQPADFIDAEHAGVEVEGRPVAVNLAAVRPRYYLYRVVLSPSETMQ